MAEIVNNLSGIFIGTVCGYDTNTREIDAYIPKLMPNIVENSPELSLKTDLNRNKLPIDYSDYIKICSTIKVKAYDYTEPLPNIGSKVFIRFLENKLEFGYWKKFNINNDYSVIEEEKYPLQAYLEIGGSQIVINKEDIISIELPKGFSVVKNEDGKEKRFRIIAEDQFSNRLAKIENAIGIDTINFTDLNNVEYTIEGSGILQRLTELEREIEKLKNNNE